VWGLGMLSGQIASGLRSKLIYRGGFDLAPSESVTLDAVRTIAAFTVFASHWSSRIVTGDMNKHGFVEGLGFPGVLVFFVLSGYVISWVSQVRETTARSYIIARLSRLYSVAIPVLILIFALQFCVAVPATSASPLFDAHPFGDLAVSLVFANQWWFTKVIPFSDAPYWSLSFEAAYYVLWGIFLHAKEYRWPLLAVVALIVGPRIILLFPLWLAGATLHRSRWRLTKMGGVALLPIVLALLVLGKEHPVLPKDVWEEVAPFPTHWIRALGVTIGLACAMALSPLGDRNRAIKWLADRSFTLYLLHYPMLVLITFYIPILRATCVGRLVIGALALAICLIVGGYIEPRKAWWKRHLALAYDRTRNVVTASRYTKT
jgi:peptidoglycan/LPS O-acetylase OafA/YrhL